MSAVQAVLVEASPYLETKPPVAFDEEAVRELIHELRQPLSSIEAIAYYLEMTLPAEQSRARQYMRRLQELVEQTNAILSQAASGVCKTDALS